MWKWTPRLVATSNEGLIKIEVPHRYSKVNQKTISNNQSIIFMEANNKPPQLSLLDTKIIKRDIPKNGICL